MSYVRTYCVLYARVHEDTIRSRACKRTKTHHRSPWRLIRLLPRYIRRKKPLQYMLETLGLQLPGKRRRNNSNMKWNKRQTPTLRCETLCVAPLFILHVLLSRHYWDWLAFLEMSKSPSPRWQKNHIMSRRPIMFVKIFGRIGVPHKSVMNQSCPFRCMLPMLNGPTWVL